MQWRRSNHPLVRMLSARAVWSLVGVMMAGSGLLQQPDKVQGRLRMSFPCGQTQFFVHVEAKKLDGLFNLCSVNS